MTIQPLYFAPSDAEHIKLEQKFAIKSKPEFNQEYLFLDHGCVLRTILLAELNIFSTATLRIPEYGYSYAHAKTIDVIHQSKGVFVLADDSDTTIRLLDVDEYTMADLTELAEIRKNITHLAHSLYHEFAQPCHDGYIDHARKIHQFEVDTETHNYFPDDVADIYAGKSTLKPKNKKKFDSDTARSDLISELHAYTEEQMKLQYTLNQLQK